MDLTVESTVVAIEASWQGGYGVVAPILNDLMMIDITGQTGYGMIESIANSCGLLASPMLGRMSDLHGRRNSILAGTLLGVLSCGLFIMAHVIRDAASFVAVGLLLCGRIVDQFSGGVSPTVRAYMADCSIDEDGTSSKTSASANMSRVQSAMGLGFSIGEKLCLWRSLSIDAF